MKIQKKLYMMVMMKMMMLLSLAWWRWWCWSFDDCVSQEEDDDDYDGGDDGDDDDVMTVLGSLFPKSTSRLMFVFCLRLLLLSFEGIIKHDNSVLFIMLLFFYFFVYTNAVFFSSFYFCLYHTLLFNKQFGLLLVVEMVLLLHQYSGSLCMWVKVSSLFLYWKQNLGKSLKAFEATKQQTKCFCINYY